MAVDLLYILLAILCSVGGNLLMKHASAGQQDLTVYLSPSFIGGGVLFGCGLVFYVQGLRDLNLSIAYPILVGGTMTGTILVAALVLKERITIVQMLGIILIFLGIVILSRHQGST